MNRRHQESVLLQKLRDTAGSLTRFCMTNASLKLDAAQRTVQVMGHFDVDLLPAAGKFPAKVTFADDAARICMRDFIKPLTVYAVGALLRDGLIDMHPLTYEGLMQKVRPIDAFLLVIDKAPSVASPGREFNSLSAFSVSMDLLGIRSTTTCMAKLASTEQAKSHLEYALDWRYDMRDKNGRIVSGTASLYYDHAGLVDAGAGRDGVTRVFDGLTWLSGSVPAVSRL